MVLRRVAGVEPTVHDDAYADDAAVVVGDVTIERDASVWPNATLRGNSDAIVIREKANVQDNAVCHEDTVRDEQRSPCNLTRPRGIVPRVVSPDRQPCDTYPQVEVGVSTRPVCPTDPTAGRNPDDTHDRHHAIRT
jgi:carbonic anhydrase/acetyltransferase-like protein (isoleucine patch superfamily)